jgi:hypothetical protein
VRAVVSQNDVIRVRSATRGVEIRLAEAIVLPAWIEREVPAADSRLPSTALGSAGGGCLAIDTRGEEGLTTNEPVFHLDLALPPDAPVPGTGRAHTCASSTRPSRCPRSWCASCVGSFREGSTPRRTYPAKVHARDRTRLPIRLSCTRPEWYAGAERWQHGLVSAAHRGRGEGACDCKIGWRS